MPRRRDIKAIIISIIQRELEMQTINFVGNENVMDLIIQHLSQTLEYANKPSPHDGFRPSDFVLIGIFMEIEFELGIENQLRHQLYFLSSKSHRFQYLLRIQSNHQVHFSQLNED